MTGWSASGAAALKLQGAGPVAVTGSVFGLDGLSVGATGNYTGLNMGNNSPIGGTAAGQRNVFSGNVRGIQVNGGGCGAANACAITGNLIGTGLSGTTAFGNTESGIRIENAYASIAGNVVSGNRGDGVKIVGGGSSGSVTANWIGTTSGGAPLGNTGAGIAIEGASGVKIGSIATADANTIAYNARGVSIISGDRHAIRGNRIFGNTTLDIDLANDGPTANDVGDGDGGANERQNFPVLATVQPSLAGGVSGTLNSVPGTYTLDFYGGPACGAAGRGLSTGSTSVASGTVVVPSSGTASFDLPITGQAPPVDGVIVGTATSPAGDTSELSGCSSFHRPVATAQTVTTTEDTPVPVTLAGSDSQGHALTFAVVSGPSSGSLSGTGATRTYTPSANSFGSDSFTFTVSDGTAVSAPATVTVSVTAVNDVPSFVKGADRTVLEDAGAQSLAGWATGISAGPANESGQVVSFVVSNDNGGLFSVAPAVAADGTLTFTPAANANGVATVTVQARDDNGTPGVAGDDVSSAPQTFTVTVTPVNDVPSFVKGADRTVLEDAGAQSLAGWATGISAGPANESGQVVSFVVSNDNGGLFSVAPAVAADGTLTFTPAANANGVATVTVQARDDNGTPGVAGDDVSSAPQTFTVTVTPVNDAPSFVKGADRTVLEDAGAQSAGWATGISAGPANESGQEVVVRGLERQRRLFSVAPAVAADGTLTFTPAANANGVATVTVQARDDNGTPGVAGDDVSSAPQTFTVTVTPVNDAPSFVKGRRSDGVGGCGGAVAAGWATGISAGPANETGQTVSFVVIERQRRPVLGCAGCGCERDVDVHAGCERERCGDGDGGDPRRRWHGERREGRQCSADVHGHGHARERCAVVHEGRRPDGVGGRGGASTGWATGSPPARQTRAGKTSSSSSVRRTQRCSRSRRLWLRTGR